ncbi:exodeoxyribonuclease VII large subunit [Candidatus Saccharibacteria bacterium]|nr:exodeoxyribonuclease VII large subunit [Candidatus Saccharibacteria bacterium]
MENEVRLTVSDFNAVVNQNLEYAYTGVTVVGEVAEYKTSQGKWVFFNLKDERATISCFLPIFQLRMALEDGMKVAVKGTPKLTNWGRFSFTVTNIQPIGEGSIKKSFELLKAKLEKEGLFAPEKKRAIAKGAEKIGVISSPEAAGYADFVKILNERWGGMKLQVARVQVQGAAAPDQIIRALEYFNQRSEVEVIAILRGGGSKDDLAAFNDEKLARAIAGSKIPVITGIGHEVDTSLADLAADVVGSTPSNVAQILTRDKREIKANIYERFYALGDIISAKIEQEKNRVRTLTAGAAREIVVKITTLIERVLEKKRVIESLNPERVLEQGYAILRGNISPGEYLQIETKDKIIESEVKNVRARK